LPLLQRNGNGGRSISEYRPGLVEGGNSLVTTEGVNSSDPLLIGIERPCSVDAITIVNVNGADLLFLIEPQRVFESTREIRASTRHGQMLARDRYSYPYGLNHCRDLKAGPQKISTVLERFVISCLRTQEKAVPLGEPQSTEGHRLPDQALRVGGGRA
jgi:hypothetical protein